MSDTSNKSVSLFKYICESLNYIEKNIVTETINTGKYIKIKETDNNSIFIPVAVKRPRKNLKTSYSLLKVWEKISDSTENYFRKLVLNNTIYYIRDNLLLNSTFEILIYLESSTSLYINPAVFFKKGIFEKFIASKLYPALVEDPRFLIHTELDNDLYEVPNFKSREELNEALDIMKKELYKKEQLFTNLYNDN